VASFQLLLDPEKREAFRTQEHGLRRGDDGRPYVVLDLLEPDDMVKEAFTQRRSYRHFSSEPIPFAQFSRLLGRLRQIRLDGKPKYLYGSAGALYPVQTYLYVKSGRVQALDGGIHYFHPADCRLVLLSKNAELDRDVYDPIINGPIFDEAAFGLFLIAQLGAIVPMYGDRSMHYAAIEAGLMAQLLEISAPAGGIGLCQVGDLDFEPIRHLFALDQSHVLVHSLLGGLIDTEHTESWSPLEQPLDGGDVSDGDWEEGAI
jgi:SagB-type dehydrogenase family enzyme